MLSSGDSSFVRYNCFGRKVRHACCIIVPPVGGSDVNSSFMFEANFVKHETYIN